MLASPFSFIVIDKVLTIFLTYNQDSPIKNFTIFRRYYVLPMLV